MGIYRRSRTHKAIKDNSKKCRLRRRTKDLDQIEKDLLPENVERLLKEVIDEDLPGGGHFLCVECSRHFIDQETFESHKGTKNHKKRVKCLAEGAYTIEEANAAGGSGTADFYNAKQAKMNKMKIEKAKGSQKQGKIDVPASMMTYE